MSSQTANANTTPTSLRNQPSPKCFQNTVNVPTQSTIQPLTTSNTNSATSSPTHKRNIRNITLNINNKLDNKTHLTYKKSYDPHVQRAVYTDTARARIPQHLVGTVVKLNPERFDRRLPACACDLRPPRDGSLPYTNLPFSLPDAPETKVAPGGTGNPKDNASRDTKGEVDGWQLV